MLTVSSEKDSILTSLPDEVIVRQKGGTHLQILKSSAMVGGSQIVNILISMVRTKAMALFLGPSGFGLFGLYSSVLNLVQTIAGMGINSSGVRQIAAAASTGDEKIIAKTVLILRKVSIILGLLGAAFMILFSRQISLLTFASEKRSGSIAWLSIALVLTLISGSQTALIQGMRRIGDLAKIQILGAFFGMLCGIPLVYFFRENGVVPSLICVAAVTIATSWWYGRKVSVSNAIAASMTRVEIQREVGSLLKLGLAFMTSALISLGVAYAIRVAILHKMGTEATGLYQSAWTLGGLYVGFILQAMGADFYPRLTAKANDNSACNRLVNEQAQVGILLATPGVIGSLTFAPIIIAVFYSTKFGAAVEILRWICLATILQVVSWPIGFVIIAQAKRRLFVGCEVAWGVVSIILAWVCINHFGLVGAGIAYFGSYVFHGILVYGIVSQLSGFRWSRANWASGLLSLSLVAVVFFGFYLVPMVYGVVIGTAATVISTVYSIRTLTSFLTPEQIPSSIRKAFMVLGIMPRDYVELVERS